MNPENLTRRNFLTSTSKAAMFGAMAAPFVLRAKDEAKSNSETLKIGLVGCGGRGSGAAKQALMADPNVQLTAVGEVFEDRLTRGLEALKADKEISTRIKVDADHQFLGFDAYQKVIDSGVDVVILASPPGFRPTHLEAAIKAGKHVFCEKPMAVDAPGVRRVLKAAEEAKAKNLSLVAGFCWRYNLAERAAMERVLDGDIGEIRSSYSTYLTGGLWMNPRQPNWTDMHWQLKNWLYFTWLSGDHLVEQAVHSVDKMSWAMRDQPPLRVVGLGGRQTRTDAAYGHIYDHFSIVYEYPNDVRGFLVCRQQDNCASDNSDVIYGSEGNCRILGFRGMPFVTGKNAWKYKGPRPDMYQVEHNELFKSIRNGEGRNDGKWMAQSTMLAILGRMAAYTGKSITWEEGLNSTEVLGPKELTWEKPIPVPPVAMPGKTAFV